MTSSDGRGNRSVARRYKLEVLSFQLRGHRDLGVEYLRYRTACLRGLRVFLKRGGIRTRHSPNDIQMARRDRPARVQLLHRKRDIRIDALGRKVCATQLGGQRHREAGRMRGRDQFFGICPGGILKSRRERIRSIRKYAARRGNGSLAVLQSALPHSTRFSLHLRSS